MKTDERFIFLIGQARSRLFARLDQSLIDAAGITAAQARALYYLLTNDGCPTGDLSRALALDESAATGLIDRLEDKGLVARRAVSSDRSSIGVFLTESGRNAARICLGVTKKLNDTLKEGLSREEIDVFSRVLKKIIRRVSI